jgi:hypothetical protein
VVLTAFRFGRLAASELGVEDGAWMLPRNGDDGIQTPDALARAVVEHFLPCGRIVEPSFGNGAFLRALPKGADWFEIQNGRDFLKAEGRWDWAVGNPPFSQFRAFLQKATQVADNVVFIALAPRVVRPGPPGGHAPGAVRPGGALRPAHPARLAPVRHRVPRRLGAPRLAGWHRPHAA